MARKPRDAAAVLFALRFVDINHYKFKSSQASRARLQSSKHTVLTLLTPRPTCVNPEYATSDRQSVVLKAPESGRSVKTPTSTAVNVLSTEQPEQEEVLFAADWNMEIDWRSKET